MTTGSQTSPTLDASFSLRSFAHIEQALTNPTHMPITLKIASIRLEAIISQDQGLLTTISLMVQERRRLMEQLSGMLKEEVRHLEMVKVANKSREDGKDNGEGYPAE